MRSNHIIKIFLIDTLISVDNRQGIDAEKNSTVETLITAIINFVTSGAEVIIRVGKNISASPIPAAFDANIGSGI